MTKKETSVTKSGAAAPGGKRYLIPAGIFASAFILAFALAWVLFGSKEPPPPAPAPAAQPAPVRTLTRDNMRGFLQAVEAGDFSAMDRLGNELFAPGAIIPDSKTIFSEYATTSFPPHLVYAFFTRLGGERTYRVLLTTDEEDRVVSFMAEEMEIKQ